MVEGIKRPEKEKESPALSYILRQLRDATPEVQDLVTGLYVQEGHRRKVLMELTQQLTARWPVYASTVNLEERDRPAIDRVKSRIRKEDAQVASSAMRPDENLPSALSWFFLSIPTVRDWEDLCSQFGKSDSKIAEEGALSLQNVVQNVLNDEPRTRAFILDVNTRVKELSEEIQHPLHIYDVGCGPFPILGIAAAIASPQARIECIEKNPLSAAVARLIIEKMGLSQQITVHTGDALDTTSIPDPEKSSIDLMITETFGPGGFDEPALQIFSRFSKFLTEKGETIPRKVQFYTTLMNANKGVSFKNGVRVEQYKEIMLNVDGSDFPVIPDWHPVTSESIDMRNPSDALVLRGSLPLPHGVSLLDFNYNYVLCACIDLELSHQKLDRYQTFSTFPIRLDILKVPAELMKKDPESLEIRYEFIPGSNSSENIRRAWVVEKGQS